MAGTEARKAAPRKGAASRGSKGLAPVHTHPKAPSGRFAALLSEVHTPEPYELTDDLIIDPPTKKQSDDIVAAQAAFSVAQGQLEEMLTPVAVAVIGDDGQPVLDAEKNPTYTHQYPEVDPQRIERVNALVAHATANFNRALFGDRHAAVMEFFEARPVGQWNAFYEDIQNHFMPVPADGKCPTCGHVNDVEQVGKPPASTSS